MLEEVMAKDGYPLTLKGRPNFGSVYYEAVRKEYACKHPDKDFVRELSKNYHTTKKDFEENNFCSLSGLIRKRQLDEERIAEECEQEGYDYENIVSYFCIPYDLIGNFFHIIGASECDFNGVSVLHIAHGLKKIMADQGCFALGWPRLGMGKCSILSITHCIYEAGFTQTRKQGRFSILTKNEKSLPQAFHALHGLKSR